MLRLPLVLRVLCLAAVLRLPLVLCMLRMPLQLPCLALLLQKGLQEVRDLVCWRLPAPQQ